MKTIHPKTLVLLVLPFVVSCTSLLPVNSNYDKAGTLKKGNVELSAQVTNYVSHQFERVDYIDRHVGIRTGLGISDRFDMKVRYEYMSFSSNFDGMLQRTHYLSFIPKFAIIPEELSFMMPISSYYSLYKNDDGNKTKLNTRSIAPQLIYTFTTNNNKTDLSVTLKTDYVFNRLDANFYLGASLGAGFSKNLDKWAVRPEMGLSTSDGQVYWNYGIGFQYILPTRKR